MNPSLEIAHDPARHQFEVSIEGHRAYLSYMDLGKQTLDFYRTFVPDELRGQGIAAQLAQCALSYAKQHGYRVIPSCSYIERYLERHPDAAL